MVNPCTKRKKKLQVPWNIGLTKETDERIRKKEEKRYKNRDYSDISGDNAIMRKYPQIAKQVGIKVSLWHKKNKDTKKYKQRNEKISIVLKKDMKTRYIKHPEWHPNRKCCNKNKRSYIEKIMKKALEKNNIDFEEQKQIKRYWVDFFIRPHIVIECDGEYWHKNKKEYDINRQKIIEDMGYKMLRFKGNEIKKDIDECLNIIKKEIKAN